MIRRNHSFLQSLALVMRARMLGVRAQTVKVEACVCKSATKQHLAVAWLHWPNQPNTDLLHVLGLAPTGLALWCDPGSSGKRTNQALSKFQPDLGQDSLKILKVNKIVMFHGNLVGAYS